MQESAGTQPAEPVANVEAKAVILLVLLAALVVVFVLYVMYARGVFEPTQRVVLVADDSQGVTPGMDMTFSGFPIGRVEQVELAADGKARILIDVPKKDARWLRTSSVFTLERGLVGETRIKAFSGVLTDPALPPGAVRTVLIGDTNAEIPRLVASARALLDNLETMTRGDSSLNAALANLRVTTGRLNGRYGVLGTALGSDEEAQKLMLAVERVNALLAKADQRVFGKDGVMNDVQGDARELKALLQDARGSLQKLDAVLVEAHGVASNARVATKDLNVLRAEVDASLRKVNGLIDEVNRKWPFSHNEEVKLP